MFKPSLPSPVIELQDRRIAEAKIRMFIKRDDLIHQEISGNKWRKLNHNIQNALSLRKKALLTFGGAFSNHIYAMAAAGKAYKIPTIGVIRGEELGSDNATLSFARDCGMILHFVSRSAFRKKDLLVKQLFRDTDDLYIIPEGGTNELAVKGCEEIVMETKKQLKNLSGDYWCTACGTGGTIGGIIAGLNNQSKVIGFSVLKGEFLKQDIADLLQMAKNRKYQNWELNTNYHFGGYAQYKMPLIDFINDFKERHQIQLDPIYTGKMFYGVFDLIKQGYFKKGSNIVLVHTGGLQGIIGFNQRFGGLIKM